MEFTTRMLRSFTLLALAIPALAQQYTISTVAGGAPPTTPAPALTTGIGSPRKLMVSGSNLYFSAGNSVYKLDSTGNITLIAGNSRAGFSGDGGPAINAMLNLPDGMAFDKAGNLYIADTLNNRVRIVDPTGVIHTFAGNGGTGVPGFWGDGGAATDALIHSPVAVATDPNGNVYIVCSADNTIRKVDPNGIISIFAGEGYRGFYGDVGSVAGQTGQANIAGITAPQDMWVNTDGTVLIADTGNAAIRKVATDGTITTISGTGNTAAVAQGDDIATKLAMISPYGVTVDSSGIIYIAEYGTNRIRKIDSTGKITTAIGDGNQGFAGDGGPANKVEMSGPTAVAVDGAGNVYFADSRNNRIRKLSGGNVTTIIGNGIVSYSGDGGPATKAQLNTPQGVAVDAAGNIYISDTNNNVVRKVATNGTITNFAGNASAGSNGDGAAATAAQLNLPEGLALDGSGNLFIADALNGKVRKVASNGTISTFGSSAGFVSPFGVATDPSGNVYVADFGGNRVRKISADGSTVTTIAGNGIAGYSGDGGDPATAMLSGPKGVAIDSVGNVYIADSANDRVRKVSSNGSGGLRIDTIAGNGNGGFDTDGVPATSTSVNNPVAVALDSVGNIYISDGSLRVRKVFLSGIITTIAGGATAGYTGDGGVANAAALNAPSGLAVTSTGNVYFADANNNAVRVLAPTGGGITATAVVNGASNQLGAISPGEVVVIYGSGIGPSNLVGFTLNSSGLVPTTTGGTSVFFNGSAAPVLYSSANQVGVIVPYNLAGSLVQMFVQYQSATTQLVNLSLATMTPAIFTLNGGGTGQAAVINNKDGSINGANHPAKAGDFVQFYITGVGQTNPPGADGSINGANSSPLPQIPATVTATIGGKAATVNFSGGAPGSPAGVIQVNVQIPSGITVGNAVPAVITVGTSNTQNGVTIAVSQ
jgi:uncharacterized protein (TIGR03437 family)